MIDALLGEGEADEAAPVGGHEVDRLRGRHLGGDDEIALVLAVFIIDEDIHAAIARLVDDLLDGGEDGLVRVGLEKSFELGEGFGGGGSSHPRCNRAGCWRGARRRGRGRRGSWCLM